MKKSLIACAVSCLLFSPVYANIPEIAVGDYTPIGASPLSLPLIAIHPNAESPWFYPKTVVSNFPRDVYSGYAYAQTGSCNNQLCVSVGALTKDQKNYSPWLATSMDQGNTWSYLSEVMTQKNDRLYGTSCTNATCFVVGMKNNSPWIMSYQQNNWEASSIPNLPADFVGGTLYNILCQENFCITTGGYMNKDKHELPFIAVSQDKEKTQWSYVPSIGENISQHNTYHLPALNCNDKVCIAAGWYSILGNYKHKRPLLATSYDQGKTWVYPKDIFTGNINGAFQSSTCYGDLCIAVGEYFTTSKSKPHKSMYPLIAVSEDAGKTWVYQKSLPNLPENVTMSVLNTVSCDNTICVAGGMLSSDDFTFSPALILSKDRGKTWEFIKSCPSHYVDSVEKIYCNSGNCTGIGSSIMESGEGYPLVMTTKDNGNTWSCEQSIISNLPEDYHEGMFSDGAFGGTEYTMNPLLKEKMKFLTKMKSR